MERTALLLAADGVVSAPLPPFAVGYFTPTSPDNHTVSSRPFLSRRTP